MEQYHKIINNFIDNTYINEFPPELHDKLKYLFDDGKRIRPILCLIFTNINKLEGEGEGELKREWKGKEKGEEYINNIILTLCVSIELMHCLSLVIDDLPEIDNDDTRRGKPAFHIKYGREYTNFFIYYVLNKLFTILNNTLYNDSMFQNGNLLQNDIDINIKYVNDILYLFKFNLNNLIDGQYLDLLIDNRAINMLNASNTAKVNNRIYPNLNNISDLYDIIIQIIFYLIDDMEIDIADDIFYEHIFANTILNIKKTGTLFALSNSVGYILQLYTNKINYIGKEIIKHTKGNLNTIQFVRDFNTFSSDSDISNDTDTNTTPTPTPTPTPNPTPNPINNSTNANTRLQFNNNVLSIFNIVAVWGYILGYMFQISDDILDYESDMERNKPNICIIMGKDNTIVFFNNGCKWLKNVIKIINENSIEIWKNFNIDIDTITQIIDKIHSRIPKISFV
jgi:geranylgeranyl pyrophosphate synthase